VDAFATNADPTPSATASVAFTEAYRGRVGDVRSEAFLRLRGDDALDRLQDFMDEHDNATLVTPDDEYAAGASDATDVLSTALLVFAIVSGLAGLFAVSQAVSRQVDAAATDTTALPSIGFTTWRWALASALPSAAAVVVGAVLAPIAAGLASGLFPIGFAERIEPDPGLRIDLPVLIGGAALSALFICAWAVWSGRRRCSRSREIRGWVPRWPWAPLTLAGGARLAFGRGRARAAGPVRSAMIGVAVAAVGLVGSATFLVSLDDLIEAPARWGYPFSVSGQVLDPSTIESVAAQFAERDDVEAVAFLDESLVRSGQDEIGAFSYRPIDGDMDPVIRRGRAPREEDEVAVGEAELDRLGLDLGDRYVLTDADGDEHEFDIVGSSVTPAFTDPRPAQGIVLTPDGVDDVTLVEPTTVITARYADGADPDVIEDEALPLGLGLLPPVLPSELSNLDEADVVIEALVVFFAALALIALVQGLVLSTRRHRRNLAVWRTLGMVPRQVRRAVLWQSVLCAGVGTLIGVPLGLYVGRVAWHLTIESVGVLDQPSLPALVLAVSLPVALVGAVLLALVPAWLAARGEPARDLHAE
jgi:hypothetical protein